MAPVTQTVRLEIRCDNPNCRHLLAVGNGERYDIQHRNLGVTWQRGSAVSIKCPRCRLWHLVKE